jgi:hypothetical protein
MTELKPNIAYLASLFLQSPSMLNWIIDFFTSSQSRVVAGITNASEELEIFRDHVMDSISRGLPRPSPALTTDDWKTLFNHIKANLNISNESVMLEIRKNEANRIQMLQGFSPKPLSDVLSSQKINEYVEELREHEYGLTFHRYRFETMLEYIDWLDRNRGPFEKTELPKKLREFLRAKSGETLAKVWLQTLPLRYPDGISWNHMIK